MDNLIKSLNNLKLNNNDDNYIDILNEITYCIRKINLSNDDIDEITEKICNIEISSIKTYLQELLLLTKILYNKPHCNINMINFIHEPSWCH